MRRFARLQYIESEGYLPITWHLRRRFFRDVNDEESSQHPSRYAEIPARTDQRGRATNAEVIDRLGHPSGRSLPIIPVTGRAVTALTQ